MLSGTGASPRVWRACCPRRFRMPMRRRSSFLAVAVKVLLASIWILPVELWARWYCRERGDALERTSVLLKADATLGWRQRGDFSGSFMGRTVHTNAQGLRAPSLEHLDDGVILILGPSSAF